jgi:hypothetical protein
MATSATPVDPVVHFSHGTTLYVAPAAQPTYAAPAAKSTYSAPAAASTYLAPAGSGASESAVHGSGIGINVNAHG